MQPSNTSTRAVRAAFSSQVRAFAGRALLVMLLVLAADQSLKTLVRYTLDRCMADSMADCDRVEFGTLDLVYVLNAGSIFGFGQGLWIWGIIAALGVLLVLIYGYVLRETGWLGALAVGLQAGGALGNLADRLLVGGGVDFLLLHSLSLVVNLADFALVVGMVLAVIAIVQVLAAQERASTQV